ncbi:MAG TPA: AraC family transcriptional regulator [Abditibacteriaceae bacterium]
MATTQLGNVAVSRHYLPPHDISDYVTGRHTIDVHLSNPYQLQWKESGSYQRAWMTAGDLCITPAHKPISMRWREHLEILSVELEPQFLLAAADDLKLRGDVEIVERHGETDRQIAHICHALWAEAEAGNPTGALFNDSLASALATCLLQRHSVAREVKVCHGQLSPRHKKIACAYIEENLQRNVSLEELSRVVGLSSFYFARCFRNSLGISPHQYLIARRLERAKRLLQRSDLPLAQIASQCGFSDQSHLTRRMKNHFGVTPATLVSRRK